MPLPTLAGSALGAGGALISNFAERGANKKRQGIVNDGIASQQGFRSNIGTALEGTMQGMSNVQNHIGQRTQAVSDTIGDTMLTSFGASANREDPVMRGKMAIANTQRKSKLSQALGGQQGMQSANFQDGMQRSQFGSDLGNINRQSQTQLFADQQRLNAVRPNAGLQFLGEGLQLGAALGGVL